MTFKSKIDWWLFAVIGAALLSVPVLMFMLRDAPRHPPMGDGPYLVISVFVVGLPVTLITWIFRTTEYTVTEADLLVRSGPVSEKIPLASIKKIVATRSVLSAPALSLDRLEIQHGKYATTVVSPEDKAAFVRAILSRVSAVTVEGLDF